MRQRADVFYICLVFPYIFVELLCISFVTFINRTNKNQFGLIVMATHGRSGLSRLVYGSVAANLLNGVSSPLFVIKPGKSESG